MRLSNEVMLVLAVVVIVIALGGITWSQLRIRERDAVRRERERLEQENATMEQRIRDLERGETPGLPTPTRDE